MFYELEFLVVQEFLRQLLKYTSLSDLDFPHLNTVLLFVQSADGTLSTQMLGKTPQVNRSLILNLNNAGYR